MRVGRDIFRLLLPSLLSDDATDGLPLLLVFEITLGRKVFDLLLSSL